MSRPPQRRSARTQVEQVSKAVLAAISGGQTNWRRRVKSNELGVLRDRLAGTLKTQVDEITLAIEFLSHSCEHLGKLSSNLETIEQKCNDSRKALPNFELIRQVSSATSNLASVLNLKRQFADIPGQAELLKEDVKEHLLEVYKKTRQLMWVKHLAEQKGLEFLNSSAARKGASTLRATFISHFRAVKEVCIAIEKELRRRFEACIILAEDNKQSLVEAVLVCEIEDQSKDANGNDFKILTATTDDWRQWQIEEEKAEADNDPEAKAEIAQRLNFSKGGGSKQKRVEMMLEKARREISEFIQRDIDQLLQDQEQDLPKFLDVCDGLFNELQFIEKNVGPRFPAHYEIATFFAGRYVMWLVPRIMNRIDVENTQAKDCTQVVKMLAGFKVKIEDYLINSSPDWAILKGRLDALELLQQELMNIYIEKWQAELGDRINRIVEQEWEEGSMFKDEGCPRTHGPQDLFSFTHFLIDDSVNNLVGRQFVRVVTLFLELIKSYSDGISSGAMGYNLEEEHLFAFVNNFDELITKVERQQEIIFPDDGEEMDDSKNLNVMDKDELTGIFDKTVKQFDAVSKMFLELIVTRFVRKDLSEIFTPDWLLKSDKTKVQDLIATVSDAFDDWQELLANRFLFDRLKQLSCAKVVEAYLDMFLSLPSRNTNEELNLTMDRDYRMLQNFFIPDEKEHSRASTSFLPHLKKMDTVAWLLSPMNDIKSPLVQRKCDALNTLPVDRGAQLIEHALRLRKANAKDRSIIVGAYRSKRQGRKGRSTPFSRWR